MNNNYKLLIGLMIVVFLNGCKAPDSLVGYWHETTLENSTDIQELHFKSDGTFGVTWIPFETRVDYWGTYKLNKQTGRIKLTVENGNFIPDDVDLDGYVFVKDNGDLEFIEMYFGTPKYPELVGPKPEKQTFSKR